MSNTDMYIVTRWETVSIREVIMLDDPNDNPEDAFEQGDYTSIHVLKEEVIDSGWNDMDEAVAVERIQYVWEAKRKVGN
ncbi:MAG: hypothetical protein ACO3VQ_09340 [Ilumatobacteraceae bacterium]